MFICLFLIVKILNSIFRGHIAKVVNKVVNSGFPGKWAKLDFLLGYLALIVGVGLTILVQSSSIFTSTLTPLVGLNIVSLERAFPMTLGANIGTTVTGLLAALASDDKFEEALQISLCHLIFNIIGILIWYPIPFMRKVPLGAARFLGKETRKYRWYAIAYLLLVFVILPAIIFGLSLADDWAVGSFCILIVIICLVITAIKVIQHYKPRILPEVLRNWKFLPVWLRSLEPYHNLGISFINIFRSKDKKFAMRGQNSEKTDLDPKKNKVHPDPEVDGANKV